jgi:hypothetical protein
MRVKRFGVSVAAAVVLGMVASTGPAVGTSGAAVVEHAGVVTVDQPLFWEVAVASTSLLTEMCGADVCRQWNFEVPEIPEGYRLRVAFHHDDNLDSYAWRVRKPGRPEVIYNPVQGDAGMLTGADGFHTMEAAFGAGAADTDAPAGIWNVGVLADQATDDRLRFRAHLEVAAPPSGPRRLLLPNLVPVAPHRFTFAAPAHPININNAPNRPLEVGEQRPVSCLADEMIDDEDHPTRCLRFSAGGFNLGDGPFDLRFNSTVSHEAAPVSQRMHYSDTSYDQKVVGVTDFHPTHGHFHFYGMVGYTLHELGQGSKLVQIGDGEKRGYCTGDMHIADWDRLDQAVQGSSGSNCGMASNSIYQVNAEDQSALTGGIIAWSRGWGDQYPPQRQGQYVTFDQGGDGLFLVRVTLDPNDVIAETDDTDNDAFAVVCVRGTTVRRLFGGAGEGTAGHLQRGRQHCP